MKKSTSYLIWAAALSSAFAFTAACSSDDNTDGTGGSAGESNGDGDGDGDGVKPGDGDGDSVGGQGGGASCGDCPDDGDPCTEDACDPETGKCGIPRTGNSCDDGVYCNGEDTCDDGKCSAHSGSPCSDTSCNEGKKSCECSQKTHCPGEDISDNEFGEAGDWGTVSAGEACSYDNVCDEDCSCGVTVTTYECVSKVCKATVTNPIDTTCGSRETDGTDCNNGSDLFCDGAEECNAGTCTAPGDPCQGTVTPYCTEASNKCVECEGSGDNSVGCNAAAGEHCCSGTCKAEGELCLILVKNVVLQNIVAQNLVNQNVVAQNLVLQNVIAQNLVLQNRVAP